MDELTVSGLLEFLDNAKQQEGDIPIAIVIDGKLLSVKAVGLAYQDEKKFFGLQPFSST